MIFDHRIEFGKISLQQGPYINDKMHWININHSRCVNPNKVAICCRLLHLPPQMYHKQYATRSVVPRECGFGVRDSGEMAWYLTEWRILLQNGVHLVTYVILHNNST